MVEYLQPPGFPARLLSTATERGGVNHLETPSGIGCRKITETHCRTLTSVQALLIGKLLAQHGFSWGTPRKAGWPVVDWTIHGENFWAFRTTMGEAEAGAAKTEASLVLITRRKAWFRDLRTIQW